MKANHAITSQAERRDLDNRDEVVAGLEHDSSLVDRLANTAMDSMAGLMIGGPWGLAIGNEFELLFTAADKAGDVPFKINGPYPDTKPLATSPPNVLEALREEGRRILSRGR